MVEAFSQTVRKASPFQWIVSGLILLFLTVLMWPRIDSNDLLGHLPSALQHAHGINLVMYQYANDHNGAYPTGKSSTEVFQKLIDEGYVFDPSLFYCAVLKIPGKVAAASSAKVLKPENVCWDVAVPLDTNSDDNLPVVFSTGYKINYTPGGSALPLFKPDNERAAGIAVSYLSNSTCFKVSDNLPDGMVTNFISFSLVPGGKTYQQLTPDGPLPP